MVSILSIVCGLLIAIAGLYLIRVGDDDTPTGIAATASGMFLLSLGGLVVFAVLLTFLPIW